MHSFPGHAWETTFTIGQFLRKSFPPAWPSPGRTQGALRAQGTWGLCWPRLGFILGTAGSPIALSCCPGSSPRRWGRLTPALPLCRVQSSSVPQHSWALCVLPRGFRARGAWWHKAGGIAPVSPRDRSIVRGQGWAGWDLWPLPCFGRGWLPGDCSGSRPEEGDRVTCGGQGDLGGAVGPFLLRAPVCQFPAGSQHTPNHRQGWTRRALSNTRCPSWELNQQDRTQILPIPCPLPCPP